MNAVHKYFLCTPYLYRIQRVFIALLSAGWTWVKRAVPESTGALSDLRSGFMGLWGGPRGFSPPQVLVPPHGRTDSGFCITPGPCGPCGAGGQTGSAPSGDKVLLCS